MELFDVVKSIFGPEKTWNSVGKADKTRNFFMVNRIMSIQFPLQAHEFNHTKVVPDLVVNWWRSALSPKFNKAPGWIFTSTSKKESNKSTQKIKNFEVVEDFIRTRYQISKRELGEMKQFFPEQYHDWLNLLSQQLGTENIKADI
jgi:hypothetical protein